MVRTLSRQGALEKRQQTRSQARARATKTSSQRPLTRVVNVVWWIDVARQVSAIPGVHVNQQTGAGAVSLGARTVIKFVERLDLGFIGSGSDAGNFLQEVFPGRSQTAGRRKKLWLHFSCVHH